MTRQNNQGFRATVRFSPRMRLASAEQERLWKGLERVVNSGDDLDELRALGRAFPDFWPVSIWHYPNKEAEQPVLHEGIGPPSAKSGESRPWSCPSCGATLLQRPTPTIMRCGQCGHQDQIAVDKRGEVVGGEINAVLNWHPACHKLFLTYRDTLRRVWRRDTESLDSVLLDLGAPEFLLGLSDLNERAREGANDPSFLFLPQYGFAFELYQSWKTILSQFQTAAVEGRVGLGMLWKEGEFYLVPRSDFQRAFYLLFRQSWRAKVCPRCGVFFVARKPKQVFCGTVCSAGSRLTSKRKWWNRVGAKRRKIETKTKNKRGEKQ